MCTKILQKKNSALLSLQNNLLWYFNTSVYKVYQFRSIIFISMLFFFFFLLRCLLCSGEGKKFIPYGKSGKWYMIRNMIFFFFPFFKPKLGCMKGIGCSERPSLVNWFQKMYVYAYRAAWKKKKETLPSKQWKLEIQASEINLDM